MGRGQGAPPAPRRSGDRSARTPSIGQHTTLNGAPEARAKGCEDRFIEQGAGQNGRFAHVAPMHTAPAALRSGPAPMSRSAAQPSQFAVDETQSTPRQASERMANRAPAVKAAPVASNSSRPSGFSRAHALLAAIERSIREHPPCSTQDWHIDDKDLFGI